MIVLRAKDVEFEVTYINLRDKPGWFLKISPHGKVPVLVGGINGGTEGDGPFADVMRFAKSQEGTSGVVSTSVFLVCPYLDLPDMGGGGLVITNDDLPKAEELARGIAMMYWQRRFDLEPELDAPAEAIKKGLQIEGGPVLLVETADCCGGGAAGDSVASLRALLDARLNETALVPVVDPEAAWGTSVWESRPSQTMMPFDGCGTQSGKAPRFLNGYARRRTVNSFGRR